MPASLPLRSRPSAPLSLSQGGPSRASERHPPSPPPLPTTSTTAVATVSAGAGAGAGAAGAAAVAAVADFVLAFISSP